MASRTRREGRRALAAAHRRGTGAHHRAGAAARSATTRSAATRSRWSACASPHDAGSDRGRRRLLGLPFEKADLMRLAQTGLIGLVGLAGAAARAAPDGAAADAAARRWRARPGSLPSPARRPALPPARRRRARRRPGAAAAGGAGRVRARAAEADESMVNARQDRRPDARLLDPPASPSWSTSIRTRRLTIVRAWMAQESG